MKKRTQKSQKRTKFLFLLIVLTAILSITATYAWFSTQRDVELSNLKVKVESAENLQISLDGENWAQSIDIQNMKQLYGTDGLTDVYRAHMQENKNYIPTELIPVSTAGTAGTGATGRAAKGVLEFVKCEIDGTKVTSVTQCNETDIVNASANTAEAAKTIIATKEGNNKNHPYLIFDMYLRNMSRRTATYTQADADADPADTITDALVGTAKPWEEARDVLYLNYGSHVWVDSSEGTTGTGLENAVRVGFMPYEGTAAITATASDVRALVADGTEKVSIWEPNSLEHTTYVKLNNKRGITETTETTATITYPVKFTATTVADINSTTDTTNLTTATTVKPAYNLVAADTTVTVDGVATTIDDLIGTKEVAKLVTPDGASSIALKPNTISKVRTYLWLEGQDPDCIDLASIGKQVNATIRICKAKNGTESTNTYQ